jgi:hypothetical protein
VANNCNSAPLRAPEYPFPSNIETHPGPAPRLAPARYAQPLGGNALRSGLIGHALRHCA